MPISYHLQDIKFRLPQKNLLKSWFQQIAVAEGKRVGELTFILCSDSYLLSINRTYLSHDYYTDIITFDYSEADTISGDVFISLDTVRANAQTYSATFADELHRVMAHGVLHLCGYLDGTKAEQGQMRAKEDACLSLLNQNTIQPL